MVITWLLDRLYFGVGQPACGAVSLARHLVYLFPGVHQIHGAMYQIRVPIRLAWTCAHWHQFARSDASNKHSKSPEVFVVSIG